MGGSKKKMENEKWKKNYLREILKLDVKKQKFFKKDDK